MANYIRSAQKTIGVTLERHFMIDLKLLIKNGVQFGHQTWRWNPKMRPYIWGQKNDVHLIDISKTAHQLEKAAQFLESIAATGKPVLWVGTKKAAQGAITQVAESLTNPCVTHRWIGGTLTNYPQVKKSVTKLLHFEDIVARSAESHYTKKELNLFNKMAERLVKNVGGIRSLTWPVGAVVVVDARKEHVAVKEAIAAGIPVVGLLDTNNDPSMINYVIPTNDDAPRAIQVILEYLAQAVQRGQSVAAARPQEEIVVENTLEKMLQQVLNAEDEDKKGAKRGRTAPGRSPQQRRPASRTPRSNS